MSGIVGLVLLDGGTVDLKIIQRMLDAIGFRGPDRRAAWTGGPVGLGHAALYTTPESVCEEQPATNSLGNVRVVLDGRIDNRDEVFEQLRITSRSETDAHLLLHAYAQWGRDCPRYLVGEYAFAIWDQDARTLICGRDALGIKPLYYAAQDRWFAFASDSAALFQIPGLAKQPDPEALTDYLLNRFVDSEQTEFKGIRRLRPAHTLTVTATDVALQQFWTIDPEFRLRLRPQEYAEGLRDVLTKAVKAQGRAHTAVGTMLSGGLDSSSVACLLAELRQRNQLTAEVLAYAAGFPGEYYDETEYIQSVQDRWGTKLRWVYPKPPRPLWVHPEAMRGDAQPMLPPTAYVVQDTMRAASSDGCRVLLGGLGGDEFADPPPSIIIDLLMRGRLATAVRQVRSMAKFQRVTTQRIVGGWLLRPMLSRLVPEWVRRLRRRHKRPDFGAPYVREPFSRRSLERAQAVPWFMDGLRLDSTRSEAYRMVFTGSRVQTCEWWDRLAASAAVEVRQPFCDRRVVEFLLSVPDQEMAPGAMPKSLLRAAMAGRLPDKILNRTWKADWVEVINKDLIHRSRAEATGLLTNSLLAQMGIVDEGAARTSYESFCSLYADNLISYYGVGYLWNFFSLEAWCRTAFGGVQ